MQLDPEAQALIDELTAAGEPDYATLTPAQARASSSGRSRSLGPSVVTEDLEIPGPGGQAMALRFFYPDDTPREWPALVYFHGGGFVTGSVDSSHGLCSELCRAGECAVVSVEYRLAPEAKFPAAVLDAYTALSYVHENADEHRIDHRRVAVGGDSAGGCLATVVARQTKERRGPGLSAQLLFYPVTDLRTLDTPSYMEFEHGPYLTRATMRWVKHHYLPDEASAADPSASPLAAQNLIGMPPTLLIVAECDPLRDEGLAYGEVLQAVGTDVTCTQVPGQIHGFAKYFERMQAARKAIAQAGDFLRNQFKTG